MVLWGFNYRRLTISFNLRSGPATPMTADFLQAGISDANALATRLRLGTSTGEVLSFEEVVKELGDPMNQALSQLNREPLATPGRPKYSLLMTPLFMWTGVDGMINPFALETIVHPICAVRAAVRARARVGASVGGSGEAEASAVGWLACMHGLGAARLQRESVSIVEARVALPPDRAQFVTSQLDPACVRTSTRSRSG
jgi:hypothetical protein